MNEYQTETEVNNSTEVYISTLADVKDEKSLVPPAKNVKFQIKKAKLELLDKENNPKNWKTIGLELAVADGIDEEGAYKNTRLFPRVCIGINPNNYDMDNKFFKNKAYLAELNRLLVALEISSEGLTINEALCESMKGKYLTANILQTERTQKNEQGERIKTGEIDNEVKYFKPVASEDLV